MRGSARDVADVALAVLSKALDAGDDLVFTQLFLGHLLRDGRLLRDGHLLRNDHTHSLMRAEPEATPSFGTAGEPENRPHEAEAVASKGHSLVSRGHPVNARRRVCCCHMILSSLTAT